MDKNLDQITLGSTERPFIYGQIIGVEFKTRFYLWKQIGMIPNLFLKVMWKQIGMIPNLFLKVNPSLFPNIYL